MGLVAKAFQDIITFSRATAGTYVNSNGYITNSSVLNYLTYSNAPDNAAWTKSNSFVQTNVLTYSQEFNNIIWGPSGVSTPTANTTIAPDGTLTADTVTATASTAPHLVTQTTAGLTGTPITMSVYAKAGTHNFLQIFHGALATNYANFNISTGVVGTVGAGFTSASMVSVGNGWFRCIVTLTPTATSNVRFALVTSNTAVYNESWAAAGTESVYLWGAQCVQGAVPGNYQATTATALPVLYADYNGVVRARKVCEDATAAVQHRINQTSTFAGGPGVYSIKIKAGERQYASIRANAIGAVFDLVTGATATLGGGTASSQNLGNGWWLCSYTNTAFAVNEIVRVNIENAFSVANSYAGDGSSGIYIADAQLNAGSTADAYYDTTASAYNAPRFDYDPVTLAAKGLLIEEQRANLLLYSNAFTSAPWVAGANTNLTATSALSPDGTVNAWKLYASNGLVAAGLRQPITKAASAITYAASVYAKAAGQNWLQLTVFDGTVGNRYWYNISTGAVGTTAAIGAGFTGVSASIVPAGNGYYRCVLLATSSTATTYEVYVYPSAADGSNGTGDASNNGVYIYGAQLEAGAFATSYMPTTGSQFTRAADVASVNTLSPWFNAVAGTIYVEALHSVIPSGASISVEIGDGTVNNRYAVFTAGSANSNLYAIVGGVNQATISATAFSANVVGKFAAASAANDFQVAGNGTLGGSDASGTLPSVTTMFIGSSTTSATSSWNGHLRRITYYPRRLTNAELQSLTTL